MNKLVALCFLLFVIAFDIWLWFPPQSHWGLAFIATGILICGIILWASEEKVV